MKIFNNCVNYIRRRGVVIFNFNCDIFLIFKLLFLTYVLLHQCPKRLFSHYIIFEMYNFNRKLDITIAWYQAGRGVLLN